MFRFLSRVGIAPMYLEPGDTLELKYNGDVILSHPIDRSMEVNDIGVVQFEDEFGMEEGIAGVFGRSSDE